MLRQRRRTLAGIRGFILIGSIAAGGLLPGWTFADPTAAAAAAQTETRPKEASVTEPSASLFQTGLHWVALERVDFDLGNPMDVDQEAGRIFVVSREGLLTYYDPVSEAFRVITQIDMNRAGLEKSPYLYLQKFNRNGFRSFGLFVEHDGDNFTAYVGHHYFRDKCFHFRISRIVFDLEQGGPRIVSDPETLFSAEPCVEPFADGRFAGHQAGGRIVSFDDDRLLVSIGDHELDGIRGPLVVSLDPASPYGKIVLIDKKSGALEIFAKGLRNPQGLTIAEDGTIYSTEHGPQGGDELNVIVRGGSYGWPQETYGTEYFNQPWPRAEAQGRHDKQRAPLFAWMPSIGVSALSEVKPGQFALWQSDLLVGSLMAETLFRLRLQDGRVVYSEPIELEERVRDIEVLDDGSILIATDGRQLLMLRDAGEIFKRRKELELPMQFPIGRVRPSPDSVPALAFSRIDASSTGRSIFQDRCSACHRLDGRVEVSVPLNGVVGREIGSLEGYSYSKQLQNDGRSWEPKLLKSFLLKGSSIFPGNRMPNVKLGKKGADKVIEYLSGLED